MIVDCQDLQVHHSTVYCLMSVQIRINQNLFQLTFAIVQASWHAFQPKVIINLKIHLKQGYNFIESKDLQKDHLKCRITIATDVMVVKFSRTKVDDTTTTAVASS